MNQGYCYNSLDCWWSEQLAHVGVTIISNWNRVIIQTRGNNGNNSNDNDDDDDNNKLTHIPIINPCG